MPVTPATLGSGGGALPAARLVGGGQQQPAQMDHRRVGRHQALARAVEDRPHREGDGGVLLLQPGEAAPTLGHGAAVLAEAVVPAGAPCEVGLRIEPRVADAAQPAVMRAGVGFLAVDDDVGGGVLVVERHLEQRRDTRLRRDDAGAGHDEGHDPDALPAVGELAEGGVVEAEAGALDRQRRGIVVGGEGAGVELVGVRGEAVRLPARPRRSECRMPTCDESSRPRAAAGSWRGGRCARCCDGSPARR